MFKILILSLSVVIISNNLVKACPSSEIVLSYHKPNDINYKQGLNYETSPKYESDLTDAINKAVEFCKEYRLKHPEAKNLAIVSDLDETLIDNRDFYKTHAKFNHSVFHAWMGNNQAPLLKPTFEFLSQARDNGFAVFFVTGRKERERVATTYNLIIRKVSYDGLFLKPNDYKGNAWKYKTEVRKKIEDMGFTIVENIGDQVSDLYGGYSIDCEKLPNKIYFVP